MTTRAQHVASLHEALSLLREPLPEEVLDMLEGMVYDHVRGALQAHNRKEDVE
jgi:hypothetical protein